MWLLLLSLPQVQIQHDYVCCATQQAKFPLSLIVILKQFIIKYEHFVQGQLHFTKNQNHTTKIAGVWFTTWITVWNHAYISLKFTIKKKKKSILGWLFHRWSCSPSPMSDPFLKSVMDVKGSARMRWSLSLLEAKVKPWLDEQLYHISSVDAESVSSFL